MKKILFILVATIATSNAQLGYFNGVVYSLDNNNISYVVGNYQSSKNHQQDSCPTQRWADYHLRQVALNSQMIELARQTAELEMQTSILNRMIKRP